MTQILGASSSRELNASDAGRSNSLKLGSKKYQEKPKIETEDTNQVTNVNCAEFWLGENVVMEKILFLFVSHHLLMFSSCWNLDVKSACVLVEP